MQERNSVELSEITPDNSFDQLRRDAINSIEVIDDEQITPELVSRCSQVVLNLLHRPDLSTEQSAQIGEYANVLCIQDRLQAAKVQIRSEDRIRLVERRILSKYIKDMHSTLASIDRLIPEIRETIYDAPSSRIVSPLAIRITNQHAVAKISRKDYQGKLIKEICYGNGKERESDTLTRLTWLAQHDTYFQPWTKDFRILAETSADRSGALSEPEFPEGFDIFEEFFLDNDFCTKEDWAVLDERATNPLKFTEDWAAMLEDERRRMSENKRKLDQEGFHCTFTFINPHLYSCQ